MPACSLACKLASETPLMTSRGSMTLPSDLDILRPYLSLTCLHHRDRTRRTAAARMEGMGERAK